MFLGDLALAIGGMTLAELKARMTGEELDFWYAYAAHKTLPATRHELYLAQAAMYASQSREQVSLDDFILAPQTVLADEVPPGIESLHRELDFRPIK